MAHIDSNVDRVPRVRISDADGNEIQAIDISPEGLDVGRRSQCAITLAHPRISRQHLRIDYNGHSVTITDMASDNGSFLDGERLPAHKSVAWLPGRMLAIGPFLLALEPATTPDPSSAVSLPLTDIVNHNQRNQPAISPAPTGMAQLRVFAGQDNLALVPGQPLDFTVTIGNDQKIVDQIRLEITGVPSTWVEGHEPPIALNPGTQQELQLKVTVPRRSENHAGSYPVTLWAHSLTHPGTSGTDVMHWDIAQFAELSVAITPQRIRTRNNAFYQLQLSNNGNHLTHYRLHAQDEEAVLRCRLDQTRVSLPPGATSTIGLTVSTPWRWFGNDLSYSLTVDIQPENDEEKPLSATAQLIHQALLPGWVLMLLIALLLAIIALLFQVVA